MDIKLGKEIQEFISKVNSSSKKQNSELDLSSKEDLSIAIMNLLSLEEHLCFTAIKTENTAYLDTLNKVREMRKALLKQIVKEPEGEVWCASKHLLATTMRLIEVGNKRLKENKKVEAASLFKNAFETYSMFWDLNLNLDKFKTKSKSFGSRISEAVKKLIDCCKE